MRRGALELFAESVALFEPLLPIVGPEDPIAYTRLGAVPPLADLRLHHGTVWRWTRWASTDRAARVALGANRRGHASELLWPAARGERVRAFAVSELVNRLLPAARDGLVGHGVDASDADRHLGMIADPGTTVLDSHTFSSAGTAPVGDHVLIDDVYFQ